MKNTIFMVPKRNWRPMYGFLRYIIVKNNEGLDQLPRKYRVNFLRELTHRKTCLKYGETKLLHIYFSLSTLSSGYEVA